MTGSDRPVGNQETIMQEVLITGMEITVFYFRHNSTLLRYAPWLIITLSIFWSVYDFLTGDSMYFIATGAIYSILAMSVAALFSYVFFRQADHALRTSDDNIMINKALDVCELAAFLLFLVLTLASAMILGANNYVICLSGITQSLQTISLSSALLFIPAITPLSKRKYGITLFAASLFSLGIPYLMPGKECYSLLPELVLRIAITIAYLVVSHTIKKNFGLEQRIRSGNTKLLSTLVNLIELRNLESGEHVNKVQDYTRILLRRLCALHPEFGLSPALIKSIVEASAMHDIGKLMIPDSVLSKPGRLNPDEFEIMKTHTTKGKEIIECLPDEILDKSFLRYSIDICEFHHEKYDGKGYPLGLSGEDIPIWAQVVSVVDCYEALTSKRCYKDAFSHEKAVQMILNGECGAFSPVITECFLSCTNELKACLENRAEKSKQT